MKTEKKENFLYHYTSAEGLIGIIANSCFWASKHNFMNDPMEIKYVDDFIYSTTRFLGFDKQLKKYRTTITPDKFTPDDSELSFSAKKTLLDYLFNTESEWPHEIDHYFIVSFSTISDSLSLWERYANQGGYILAFRKDLLMAELSKAISKLKKHTKLSKHRRPVKYVDSHERMGVLLEKPIIDTLQRLRAIGEESYSGTSTEKLHEKMMATLRSLNAHRFAIKTRTFFDEKEYRFVLSIENSATYRSNVNFRSRDGVILPYISVELENLECLEYVVVSPLLKESHHAEGVKMLLEKYNLEHVPVWHSNLQYRKWN